MKTLMIMRHAKSNWNNTALSDHDRPLNGRGRSDAPRMGKLLNTHDLVPDLIVSSTAVRAADTAGLVAISADYKGEIIYTRDLYHAEPETYIAIARTLDDRVATVMMVGHNPGIEELVADLSGHGEHLPTAALAVFEVAIDSWRELSVDNAFELKFLWLPKAL